MNVPLLCPPNHQDRDACAGPGRRAEAACRVPLLSNKGQRAANALLGDQETLLPGHEHLGMMPARTFQSIPVGAVGSDLQRTLGMKRWDLSKTEGKTNTSSNPKIPSSKCEFS